MEKQTCKNTQENTENTKTMGMDYPNQTLKHNTEHL